MIQQGLDLSSRHLDEGMVKGNHEHQFEITFLHAIVMELDFIDSIRMV